MATMPFAVNPRSVFVVTKDEFMKVVWRDSFVEESAVTQAIFC
jgi:DNA-binding winged helix-turn-helix (wHTH) protein